MTYTLTYHRLHGACRIASFQADSLDDAVAQLRALVGWTVTVVKIESF